MLLFFFFKYVYSIIHSFFIPVHYTYLWNSIQFMFIIWVQVTIYSFIDLNGFILSSQRLSWSCRSSDWTWPALSACDIHHINLKTGV